MERARNLLDGLRNSVDDKTVGKLDISVYNQFIVTYFDLATSPEEPQSRKDRVKSAWDVWENVLEDGVQPDLTTYGSILLLIAR